MDKQQQDGLKVTAIAIDIDKNSQGAVKWAVDNILSKSSLFVLIHVKTSSHQPSGDLNGVPKTRRGQPPNDNEVKRLFQPLRGLFARKSVKAKEVVLQDHNVANALTNYINNYGIGNVVVGASNQNFLIRKFKGPDVPTCLSKSAPESCSVYVIGKGKIQHARLATRTATPGKAFLPSISPQVQVSPLLPAATPDTKTKSNDSTLESLYYSSSSRISTDNDIPTRKPAHLNTSSDVSFAGPLSFQSTGNDSDNTELSGTSHKSKHSSTSVPSNELVAEVMRLKLELKQTEEMYNATQREAISYRQKERQLSSQMTTEAQMLKETRYAEGSALAMVDRENQKSKSTTESQMVQLLAGAEAGKRNSIAQELKDEEQPGDSFVRKFLRYRYYSLEDIEVSTDYFSASRKIGEGGYGPVYRGLLDHTPVAIKVLRPDAAEGRKQFEQEVEVLSCMRHPNMVLLLGACPEYGCLVYEYMDNGSLEDRLLQKNNTPPIPWQARFRIAMEIVTALLYLHQAKPEPLVHRDLKPANILLDRNYVSKISDVGLARLVPSSVANNVTHYHMTAAAGTFCYIDPEYQQTGLLSVKSDTYSLGVMLLQILTAMPPMGLTHKVEMAVEDGRFAELLDKTVTDWPVEEALSLANLALRCCELRKRDRPDLGTVVLPELQRLTKL